MRLVGLCGLPVDGWQDVELEVTWLAFEWRHEADYRRDIHNAWRCRERAICAFRASFADFLPVILLEIALGLEAILARAGAKHRQRF